MSIQWGWVQGKFPLVPGQAVGGLGPGETISCTRSSSRNILMGEGAEGRRGEGRGSTRVISHKWKSSRDSIDGGKRAKEPPGNQAAA